MYTHTHTHLPYNPSKDLPLMSLFTQLINTILLLNLSLNLILNIQSNQKKNFYLLFCN